ncbi:lactosylceramide 4-alpha-galactosyltransferase [Culex quinquefasciatus]|uniref:Lactosylceramide 4-alpha-galactosyltransferase n=1 Tax=Culex quinquefasciatus TaxID=7176 RepID=B0W226_CULQU|nr:lactosylceramide 4-alpha-galactosyltransferase [Culex quinquefasciatus]|eukprot:XP_001842760.1 lactosylceramide 4-alpha-galactosyltransferase [Culex quinquefasciatus]
MVSKEQKIFIGFVTLAILVLFIRHELIQSKLVSLEIKLYTLHGASINYKQSTVERYPPPNVVPKVYELQQDGFYRLPDVQANEAELQYKSEMNIFFVVSTIFQAGMAKLTPRQSCAIESAARANPSWKVFVLFVAARGFSFFNSSDIVSLLPLENVYLSSVNMSVIAYGTPLEELVAAGTLNNASYVVENTSDLLRLLAVYKYGGTYLDTDVVVMKSFNELPLNYMVSSGDGYVANGFINLQASGVGHEIAELFLRDAAQTFNGDRWAANGPSLVTRVLQKFCNITEPWYMTREKCGGQFVVLPPEQFFQVYYPQHSWFFEEKHTEEVMERMKGRILTHVWNRMTSDIKIRKDSKVAYIELAKQYCPNVLKFCDTAF